MKGQTKRADEVGEVGVLNVGAGDTKLSFDPSNPAECIRAARIVKDMIRRGYSLLIEHPPGSKTFTRALDFDEQHCEYIIADFDPLVAQQQDDKEAADGSQHQDVQAEERVEVSQPSDPQKPRRGRPPTKRVAAGESKAVAVPRVSGG